MPFDAASSASADTGTSLTWSHTCSGSDRILIVTVGYETGGAAGISSVTYNGVAMTEMPNSPQENNQGNVAMFYMVNPPTGANTVAVSMGDSNNTAGLAQSRTGIDQSTPLGTDVGATGNSSAPSVTVSSASGEECVCGFSYGRSHATITMDSPGTSRGTEEAGGSGFGTLNIEAGHGEQAGDTSVTMAWSATSGPDDWAMIGVPLKPSSGGTTGTGSQTVPEVAQAASGAMLPDGDGAQNAAAPTQAASGAESFAGTGATSLPAPGQTASAAMFPAGDGAQTREVVSQSASGLETIAGTAAQNHAALAQAASGILLPDGAGAQNHAAPTQAASATHTQNVAGTGTQAVQARNQSADATVSPVGVGAQTLTALTQAAAGERTGVVAAPVFLRRVSAASGLAIAI